MTLEEARKTLDIYKRISHPNYLIQLIPLYFTVNTFTSTERYFGVGSTMRINRGQLHRLISIRPNHDVIEFRMCPLPAWRNQDIFTNQVTFSYSHQDVSPTDQTKEFMDSIFSTKTIPDKIKGEKQILKFNPENLYNFST